MNDRNGRRRGQSARKREHSTGFSVLIVLPLFLLLSCWFPFDDRVPAEEKASLTVSFSAAFSRSGSTSRTVLPQATLGITSITVEVRDSANVLLGSGIVASASETCSISGIIPGR